MIHKLMPFLALSLLGACAGSGPSATQFHPYGTWSCGSQGKAFTLSPTRYDMADERSGRIADIGTGRKDYAFRLEDGRRFSMLDVGYLSATFYAVDAGDTLGCLRADYDERLEDRPLGAVPTR